LNSGEYFKIFFRTLDSLTISTLLKNTLKNNETIQWKRHYVKMVTNLYSVILEDIDSRRLGMSHFAIKKKKINKYCRNLFESRYYFSIRPSAVKRIGPDIRLQQLKLTFNSRILNHIFRFSCVFREECRNIFFEKCLVLNHNDSMFKCSNI